MRKNKKQKMNDSDDDDELFYNNKQNFTNIENIKKKIEEGEKKEEEYTNKMEERDLDLIERLYYENKLKYNEIWIEYLIKQLNDLRNNNCKDLFDSDSDSDNDYDYSDMQMETKDTENIENYNRLIKKLQNKLNLEEISEAQINHKEEDSDNEDTSDEDEDDYLDFYKEEELEDEEMQDFILSKNDEEEEYNKSIERIKKVMNDNKSEDYIIGMNSLYLMLEKIIVKNKNYKKINKEWEKYYKKNLNNMMNTFSCSHSHGKRLSLSSQREPGVSSDNIIINNQKYNFFREKIINKK